jgi:hypothetical protein
MRGGNPWRSDERSVRRIEADWGIRAPRCGYFLNNRGQYPEALIWRRLGYLVAGFIGACILIGGARAIRA